MKVSKLFKEFVESEKSSGIILIFCTLFSLYVTNSEWGNAYHHLWKTDVLGHSLEHWINDGLMTIFFLLVGLELEREIYIGELSKIKEASFPIIGALGGMIVPVIIYTIFNYGTETISGSAIPMSTDIAFALGILSLLGNKVPLSLKIFLTALAVIDDLGAIVIIGTFYSNGLNWTNLLLSLGTFALLGGLNFAKIRSIPLYLLGGIAMWYFMGQSGVHPTITGVLLAFAIPFDKGDHISISTKIQHFLHKPVSFGILPVFALANTAIILNTDTTSKLLETYSLGIFTGLSFGKPIGIFLFCLIASRLGISKLPKDLSWASIVGVGFLGGIGFTMSIFITNLSFNQASIVDVSKFSILLASLVSAIIGFSILSKSLKQK
ncbi:Na+/H+ antiporter NhaA [Aquirufa ecclesiirivi]|uniref:Na+/H+ antiporter NhaA n=1 Tax=Aquirufa ecclesiirivi TaxID=2715124 RepID=UPI0022A80CAA|nr:Na+/H+ antiporter NhaA [Aquirufa ecclesiirivi]MCZ2471732.1 Na+/H+ antiporter NhaA [Aquirufa ecclesiirivi]MDF0693445.1 Na+/H+ antiporter NhaA [Aquirufa ecclesiirivi]